MEDNNTKRLSRLTAILTQLQSKRLLTATSLADKFQVSVRTIYRDIRALEESGVPIITEEGKGYTLMNGYIVPPVMFTENEANALITAEQLLQKNRDRSFSEEYTAAINKIKAVFLYSTKEKADFLSKRIAVSPVVPDTDVSNSLTLIQNALTDFKGLKITYHSKHKSEKTERNIEPFALYYNLQESWTLIAYCNLRNDYRMFRLTRILQIEPLRLNFKPHKLTLKEYLNGKQKNFHTPDIRLS